MCMFVYFFLLAATSVFATDCLYYRDGDGGTKIIYYVCIYFCLYIFVYAVCKNKEKQYSS